MKGEGGLDGSVKVTNYVLYYLLRRGLGNTIFYGFHKMKEFIKNFSVMNTKLQTNKNPVMIKIMMPFT